MYMIADRVCGQLVNLVLIEKLHSSPLSVVIASDTFAVANICIKNLYMIHVVSTCILQVYVFPSVGERH